MESGNSAYQVRREQNAQDPRAQVDCRFYQHGACRNGHTCPYRHQESVDQDVNITIVPPAHDKQPTKLVRAYSGVLAYFQAGVSIYRIRFISDLSIVELTGLPLDWTRDNVDGFLIAQNIGIRHVQEIHVFRGRSHSSARVEFGDPNAAESVVAAFNQLNARQETGVNAIKVPVEAFLSSNSSTLPIDCNTVHCSWPQSSKKVWLIFKKAKVAQRVAQRFRDGQYRILNQVVGSAVQTPGRPSEVCCTEVSLDATPEDVSRAIWRTEDKPHSIEEGLPRYMETADECAAEVRAQLETISPLRSFELTTQDAQSKYMGAIAKFENGEHAAKVAGTLHDTPLPFLETANLSVQQVYCARYKVSNRLYRAVERQIGAHVQQWAAQSLNFTDHEQAQSSECHRILKIEGRDRKDIVAANKVISDILEGVIAKDGSSNLWHPSMRVDGELARKLEKLEQETGVVIIRNKAKSQIKLFGTPVACDAVNEKISRILNAQRWKDFVIKLDTDKFRWARLGGYKQLTTELGRDSVSLDITSTPKRIIITGPRSKYDAALSIINNEASRAPEPDSEEQNCSVCWGEAENPLRTNCGHLYCLDCFESMCLSATTQNRAVRVQCCGDDGRCEVVLDLPQLQEHLSSSAFEELLEQMFATFARLNPHRLRFCPSPGCDHAYCANGDNEAHTCTTCLVPICVGCHAQHGVMTCGDYQYELAGGKEAHDKLKEEMGIKDCPRCGTPLEKTQGCNHMQCCCGAHICWVCMGLFGTSKACYDHMFDTHGGIGLQAPQPGEEEDPQLAEDEDPQPQGPLNPQRLAELQEALQQVVDNRVVDEILNPDLVDFWNPDLD